MLWLAALVLVVLVFAARRNLPKVQQAFREARQSQHAGQVREMDRSLAKRILQAEELPTRDEAPFPLREGEKIYYQTDAERVRYRGEGRTERIASGAVWVTGERLVFLPNKEGAGGVLTIPCADVQRVDSIHSNLLEVTYLKDAQMNMFDTVWFTLPRPLTLSAILSRFAGFDLVLG